LSRRKKRAKPSTDKASDPAAGFSRALLPPEAAWLAFSLWALLVAGTYAKRGIRLSAADFIDYLDLVGHLPGVLAGGLFFDLLRLGGIWLLFHTVGGALMRRIGVPAATRGERTAIAFALGAGTLSVSLLGLGLIGAWGPGFLTAAFYSGAAVCAALFYRDRGLDRGDERTPPREARGPFEWAACAVAAAAVLMGIIATTTPEIFYDSLVYHLSLPKLYLLRGQIVPTPENVYSGLPFGVQMLYGLTLAISGENLAALLHASFGVGAALSLWAWMRRWAADSTGALAALLLLLTPIALYASWHAGVDLGACFYVTTGLLALSRAVADPTEAERGAPRPAWAIATGLLVGFAASTKYNVGPLGAAFVLVHAFLARRAGRRPVETLWLAGAAAAVYLPWLFKNAFFYGNPVYPFLNGTLGWAAPALWKPFLEAAGSRDLAGTLTSVRGLGEFLLHPWSMSTGSWPLGDWPGPAYITLTPWIFAVAWGLRREREGIPRQWTALVLLAASGYAAWALTSKLVRFLLPVLPLIAGATALAIDRGGFPNRLRRFGWGLALLGVLFGFQAAFRQGWGIGQWGVVRGKTTRYEYLTNQRVTYGLPYYAATEWMDDNLPADAKVLFIGESRAFYSERDFIAATVYDHNPFWVAAREAGSAGELRERLRGMGVTHIFQSARQLHFRYDSPAILPRDVVVSDTFMEFWATYTELLWEDRVDKGDNPRWMGVYSLLDSPKTERETYSRVPARFVLEVLKRQGK
jgi:hypothetical protein